MSAPRQQVTPRASRLPQETQAPAPAAASPAVRQAAAMLGVVAVLVAPFVLAWGAWRWMTHTRGFAVRSVVFAGLVNADAATLQAASGAVGKNAFALDLDAVRRRLLADPWIAEATVRRALPHELRVTVKERTPVAIESAAGGGRLVAADGLVLMENPPRDRFALPEITGLAERAPESRDAARDLAAATLDAVRVRLPEWSARVTSIDASSADKLVIVAKESPPLWLSGPESADELAAWARREGGIAKAIGRASWVDARWRDRLYVVPARGTGA